MKMRPRFVATCLAFAGCTLGLPAQAQFGRTAAEPDVKKEILGTWEGFMANDDGSPQGYIKLEITEGLFIEHGTLCGTTIQELRRDGFRIVLDDFGTGYSSLSALQQFPVGTLKIDQSFVRHATVSREDATLVRTIIEMGKNLDLKVVAATDQHLERVGVIAGASIYPFVWNVLLAARQAGFGGTITTMAVAEEPRLQALLNIPPDHAVAAIVPLGRPVKQLTRLRRRPVAEIATRERFDGPPFGR